jgi:hypothetical protein
VLSQLFPAFKSLSFFTLSKALYNRYLADFDMIEGISVLKSSGTAFDLAFKTQKLQQLFQVSIQLFVPFKIFAGWTKLLSLVPFHNTFRASKSVAL